MPTRHIDYPNTGGPSEERHGEPGVHERVETGPVQFGDDWTGLFIRGDNAMALALDIKQVREWYDKLPEEERKKAGLRMAINGLAGYEKLILEEVIEK